MRIRPVVDVVIVGFSWPGAIMAQKLTEEGLEVRALERGVWSDTSSDYAVTNAQNELRFRYRHELFESVARETITFHNNIHHPRGRDHAPAGGDGDPRRIRHA